MDRPNGRDFKAEANLIVEDAARRLGLLLAEAAAAIDPFPFFAGTLTQIVEVEPEPVRPADVGFVGVGPDGGFHEYVVSMDPDAFLDSRRDSVKPVELAPRQYLQYALAAIDELSRLRAHV